MVRTKHAARAMTSGVGRIREQGVSVFLVEQNVHQTLAIADYGYVLSKGQVVAKGVPDTLARSPEVHQAYFG
jgi:branched-chain amino acid transport system ATP-binding protein